MKFKFFGVLFLAATVALLLSFASHAADDPKLVDTWNRFIDLMEKKDMDGIKQILASDISPEFLKGIEEQVRTKSAVGIESLKKMKYVKQHRTSESIVKLGFEAEKVKDLPQEYLWVVFKKEKSGYKLSNFEPTHSLEFFVVTFKPALEKGQDPHKTAETIIDVLKKRLAKMEYTNFSFETGNGLITLEISGIEVMDSFKSFIVKSGNFSLNRCWPDAEKAAAAGDRTDELFEYQYFPKKEIKKYLVSTTAILTNSPGAFRETVVTSSSLHVPQVQIDLADSAKLELMKYTSGAAKDNMSIACVLDHKVLSAFNVKEKIVSGRIWIEEITLVQSASMINALVSSGPLPCGIEIVSVDKK